MDKRLVISDTSCFITLSKLNKLFILKELYSIENHQQSGFSQCQYRTKKINQKLTTTPILASIGVFRWGGYRSRGGWWCCAWLGGLGS